MTVFKAFLRVLNKCKVTIIIYTVILVSFGAFNMQSSENSTNFVASKPDILIINNDVEEGITKSLINYLKENCNLVNIKENDEAINDALFYRDVNYIIYIPKDYRANVLAGKNPELEIKTTGDYQSSYAEMLLTRYINIVNTYIGEVKDETDLIEKVESTLSMQVETKITSKLDTTALSKATFYYNFASYSLLAGAIFVICLILNSFNKEDVKKRALISSMNYKKHNFILLLSNSLFAIMLWAFYVILSILLIGTSVMFSKQGLIYILNSLIFTICTVTIAFLISNLINNKNAINGIVNVVALGSSFLCGAFIPVEWLPKEVLKIAHILPSYWYIQTNELIKSIEEINIQTIKPAIFNMIILLIFSFIFIIISNIVSKNKRRIN